MAVKKEIWKKKPMVKKEIGGGKGSKVLSLATVQKTVDKKCGQ